MVALTTIAQNPGGADAQDLGTALGGRFRPRNNKVALIGHSMNSLFYPSAVSSTSRDVRTNTIGWLIHFQNMTRGRYSFPQNCRFAVPGVRINDVINTNLVAANGEFGIGKPQLQNAIECDADIVVLMSEFNDITNGTTLEALKTGYKAVADGIVGAGKRLVVIIDPPRGVAYRVTGTALAYHLGFRDWCLRILPRLYKGAVSVVDTWTLMADPDAATPGDAYASVLQADGAHPNCYGGWIIANAMRVAFERFSTPVSTPSFHQPGDIYDATNNPAGNLIKTAPALYTTSTGSAGTTSGGVTYQGVRPGGGGYFANTAMQGGTLTVTGSMVKNARGAWWQTQIQGNTGSTAGALLQLLMAGVTVADLAVGDVLHHMAEYEIDAGGTGLIGAGYQMSQTATSWSETICQHDGSADAGIWDAILAAGLVEGVYSGDLSLTVKSGVSAVNPSAVLRFPPSTAVNIVYRIRNSTVRKVLAS